MEKSRLFICGDSWVQYSYPEYYKQWTYFLTKHYDVKILGNADADNISITYQIGEIPDYKKGDRIIVFFTDPARIFRKYFIKETDKKESWLKLDRYTDWNPHPKYFDELKVTQYMLWENDMRYDEINFYRKMKDLLSKWKPIMVTWSDSFYQKTNDFTHFIDASRIKDEGHVDDLHPGIKGHYELYTIMMKLLENNESLYNFNDSSLI